MSSDEFLDKAADLAECINHECDLYGAKEKELIDALAAAARETELFKLKGGRGKDCFKDMSAYEIWKHMVYKVCCANSALVIRACIILCMPYLQERIEKDYEKIEE